MIDEKKLIEDVEFAIKASNKQHDNYMTGLRNGMRYCLSLITGKEPEFEKCEQWIPCSERLPEAEDLHEISIDDCMCYLIQRRCGVMDVAHYINVYGEPYFEAHCIKFNDVIAWMSLSEPYSQK